jgi:NADH-quinone oxidoreductase subunit L
MYLLIIFLPLFGALISGFGGRWIGCYGSSVVATVCVILSAVLSLLSFYEVGFSSAPCYLILSTWIESGTFIIN